MAKKKKHNNPFKPFESRLEYCRYIRISCDMMKSKAYQDLTMTQRQLYFEMKCEYVPEKSTGGVVVPANDKNILFPVSKWSPLYNGNQRAWKRDRDALIAHGFIECSENGKSTRTPNVYSFSCKWKEWKSSTAVSTVKSTATSTEASMDTSTDDGAQKAG